MEINGRKTVPSNPQHSLSATQAERPEPLDDEWVGKLFLILQTRYGHKWLSAYPPGRTLDIALGEWALGLAGFSADEIKHGLDSWDCEWPPTLPQFREVCRPKPTPAAHRDHPHRKALPAPANRDVGNAALAGIRKRHGYRTRPTGSP